MTEEKIEQAQAMRDKGMAYRGIGKVLGVSGGTIQYHLTPGAKDKHAIYVVAHRKTRVVYDAAYYIAHKERVSAHRTRYRSTHKEEANAYKSRYHATHKKKMNAVSRAYRVDHEEELRVYSATYRAEHRKEQILYLRSYHATHKEEAAAYIKAHSSKYAERSATRRALIAGALIGATANQLAEVKEIYRRAKEDPKVRCYLCGRLIPKGERHVDHVDPLSKGGSHRPSNLAVACATCNLKKHDKLPEEIGLLL